MEYILYDVDKIKDYVFDSFRPREVQGASELLKALDYQPGNQENNEAEKKEKLLRALTGDYPGLSVIYSKGGSGLLYTPGTEGAEICSRLENTFAEHLKGAGSLTAVSHPREKDFPTTMAILNFKSRDKKAHKLLTHDLNVTQFKLDPQSKDETNRCFSCGKRAGENPVSIKGEGKVNYCDPCHNKLSSLDKKKEKSAPETLEDICKAPGVPDSTYILAIYGDINEAGSHLAHMNTEAGLKEFSRGISGVIETTRRAIESQLENRGFKYLAPITGGDDLFIFIHPAAFDLVAKHLFGIETKLREKMQRNPDISLKMNFAILLAKHNFPIYHLFKKTQDLLDLTKEAYYHDTNRQTHHGLFKILEGQSRPNPEKDVYPQEEFKALYAAARHIGADEKIHKSALYTLMESISAPYAGLEKDMNIRYFKARHREFSDYIVESDGQFYLTYRDSQGHQGCKILLGPDVLEDIIIMKDHFNLAKNGSSKEDL